MPFRVAFPPTVSPRSDRPSIRQRRNDTKGGIGWRLSVPTRAFRFVARNFWETGWEPTRRCGGVELVGDVGEGPFRKIRKPPKAVSPRLPVVDYCASVSPSVRSLSMIVRRAVHHCGLATISLPFGRIVRRLFQWQSPFLWHFSIRTMFLDLASVRGLVSPPPQDGIRGFGRPISLRAICHWHSPGACRTGRSRRPGRGRTRRRRSLG